MRFGTSDSYSVRAKKSLRIFNHDGSPVTAADLIFQYQQYRYIFCNFIRWEISSYQSNLS